MSGKNLGVKRSAFEQKFQVAILGLFGNHDYQAQIS